MMIKKSPLGMADRDELGTANYREDFRDEAAHFPHEFVCFFISLFLDSGRGAQMKPYI
jgi:hypothetical protein